jgi:hypothetical protein
VSDKYAQTQVAPIRASVEGIALIGEANVKRAIAPRQYPVTVTVAGIRPVAGMTSEDAFLAIMTSLEQRAGPPESAVGGQAFLFKTPTPAHIYISPIAIRPYLLLLVTVARPDAPSEPVVEHILERLGRDFR